MAIEANAERARVGQWQAVKDLLPRHLQLIRHLAGSVEPAEKHHLQLVASA